MLSDGTVVWNASGESEFKCNIFGIARDDASGLNQQIAKSENSGDIVILSTDEDFEKANGMHTPIANDLEALVVGSNCASATATQTDDLPSAKYSVRLKRTWKIQSNMSQPLNVKFEGYGSSWVVLASDDGTFANAQELGRLNENGILMASQDTVIPSSSVITLAKYSDGFFEVIEDINGNQNGTAATAAQINSINGVSGAEEGISYVDALQHGTYNDSNNPTVEEIQKVIDAANKVQEFAGNPDAAKPSKEDLVALGVDTDGVDNDIMNAFYKTLESLSKEDVDTKDELQNIIDTLKAVKAAVDAGEGDANTTQALLTDAGITPSDLTEGELAQVNEELDKADPKPTTTGELKELVNEGRGLIEKIDEFMNKFPNVSIEDINNLGLKPTDLTQEEINKFIELVTNEEPKPTTLGEFQGLLDSAILDVNAKVEHNENDQVVVSGRVNPGSKVVVTFPDGTTKEVVSDENGNYSITSDDAIEKGTVKVKAIDSEGIESKEMSYYIWYKKVEGEDAINITYTGDENTTAPEVPTKITIDKDLKVNYKESNDGHKVELEVKAPTTNPTPKELTKELPQCSDKDYIAYVKLDKDTGEVETGYTFDDKECSSEFKDATVYDSKPLKFVPGTEVKIEDVNEKGGKVMIVDAILDKPMKFGEK